MLYVAMVPTDGANIDAAKEDELAYSLSYGEVLARARYLAKEDGLTIDESTAKYTVFDAPQGFPKGQVMLSVRVEAH